MLSPTKSSVFVSGVRAANNLLYTDEGAVIVPAMMAAYDEHDWNPGDVDSDGSNDRTAEFPAGALLGWSNGGSGFMQAWTADAGEQEIPHKSQPLYVWTAAAINNRGKNSNATIPASLDSLAVVLCADTDISDYDYSASNNRPIVEVYWRGTFLPQAILQDVDSISGGGSWPLSEGSNDRIHIYPVMPGYMA